jgi:antitoxin ParD1/3/4
MSLNLPAETMRTIEVLVASGDYESAEQVVIDGLRLLVRSRQVREDIQKGVGELDAGQTIDGAAVFSELRQRIPKITGHRQ